MELKSYEIKTESSVVTKTQCLKVCAVSVSYDYLNIHLRELDILENLLKKYCMKRAVFWKAIVSLYWLRKGDEICDSWGH